MWNCVHSVSQQTFIEQLFTVLQAHQRGSDHFLFTFMPMTPVQGLVQNPVLTLCVMLLLLAWPEVRGGVSLGSGGSCHSLKLAS